MTFFAICAGLTTLSLMAIAVQAVLTLSQIRKTASALECAISNINAKVNSFNGLFDTARSMSEGIRFGWTSGFEILKSLFTKKTS